MMAHLCNEINLVAPKHKVFGIFGGSTWNGAGIKDLRKFAAENSLEITAPEIEINGAPNSPTLNDSISELVKNIAKKIQK